MIYVECRKYKNLGDDCCKIYGGNPEKATRACADDCFENYKRMDTKSTGAKQK